MRALVLGGTGMLGRAVACEGRRRGAGVLALSRAQADIADPDRLAYWCARFDPEVVFNCAAFTKVDDCERERDRAFQINGEAVANVVEAAGNCGARVVHVSTDYVFDGQGQRPYREGDPVAPQSAYGASKLVGEQAALDDPRSLVVRTSWLFGPDGPNFVATMLRLISEGRTPLRVVDDQVGAPTYTPFLARALWDLAAQNVRGVIHYCNREATSWCGFTRAIVASTRPETEVVPVTTDEFPRPAPRPRYSVLDTGRIERSLGRPVEPWLAGLSNYLATFPRLQGCPGGNR